MGEYLYYSRAIPWEALIDALVWQRRMRPSVGQIAVEWNLLTQEDVYTILREQVARGRKRSPFTTLAVELGLLKPFGRLAVLGRQRALQPRIGAFFVEHGYITEPALAAAVALKDRSRRDDRAP